MAIKIEDFDFDNILIDEKSYESVWFITFHTKHAEGFIRIYDGTRYLVLFDPEKYDSIYNRIRYFISQSNGLTYVVVSHNYTRIKIDSYDFLPLEKISTLYNAIILIKSVFNKE